MRTRTKTWFLTAAALVLVGCVFFGGVMTMFKWDFTKLSTGKYETNDYRVAEEYQNISIVTDTADIVFVTCEDQETAVFCYEPDTMKHSVTVKDGTLVIEVVDTRKWYEYIGIRFGLPKITVSIPPGEYGTLSVKTDTGNVTVPKNFLFKSIDIAGNTGNVTNDAPALENIKIKTSTGHIVTEDISAKSLDLSVSTGGITVSNVTCEGDVKVNVSTGKTTLTEVACKNVISGGNTGDIALNTVIAAETFSIKRSTGDVKFNRSDAAQIFVETDTGDVTGSLLTDKVFITHTDTGRVDVPKTVVGGRCEITTDTGDIRLNIP